MRRISLCLLATLIGCAASQPEFRYAIPNMMVKDIHKSADFYTRSLGFTQKDIGPNFVVLRRNQTTLALIQATDKRPPGQGWCYLMVTNVRPLFEEYRSAGVDIVAPYQDWGSGHVEFTILDPDGNKLDVGN